MSTVTRRSRRDRVVVPVLAVLLAALAGGVLLWTIKGHQSSPATIPVAIVNNDQPVTTGSGDSQKTVAGGRALAANLAQPPASAPSTPLSWQLLDADDAQNGLQDGSYYGVLTIPPDFSANLTSTGGTSPKQAGLQLTTNDAASAAVSALAQVTVDQAARALGEQVTSGYINNLLTSFTTIHTNLTSSATSAQTLATSSDQLASSTQQVADSSAQVASGASNLDQGTTSLASGAASLSSGAAQTASGAAQVATGATSLTGAAQQLATGASGAANGAATLSTSAGKVATAAGAVATQAGNLQTGLDRSVDGAGRLADASSAAADRVQALADSCPQDREPVYCARVTAAAADTRAVAAGAQALGVDVRVQDERSRIVAEGSQGVATAVGGLATAAGQLNTGLTQLSSGTAALSTAAGQLATGAGGVATGTRQVATGASQTSTGASQLATGASQLATGSTQLATGSTQLASGAGQLASGNEQLATGLTSGAQQVPSYTDDQRTALVTVATTPVDVGTSADQPATVAASLVPVVLGLVLWIGTLMVFLTGPPVPTGPAWAQASPGRRVLARFVPAFLVGLAQAVVVLALVALSGVSIGSPVGALGMCVLAALAFAATNQALVSLFGGIGRMVSLAFVAVQAAAFGGLVPIATAPGVIQTLNSVLPLPQLLTGTQQQLLGAGGNTAGPVLVLLAWTALPLLASIAATRRRRPALADPARPVATPTELVPAG